MDSCAKPISPAQVLQAANRPDQFLARIHARILSREEVGSVIGELVPGLENRNPWGSVHGGALATLADTVAGTCAVTATNCVCVTVSSSLNYLRPAVDGTVICTARPEHIGKTISVVHVILAQQPEKPLATGDFTFCAVGPLENLA